MRLSKQSLLLPLFLLVSIFSFAQTGIIKGLVFDGVNNEPIPFANVVILGTTTGTTTDIDGKYELTGLQPGVYTIVVSYLGYQNATAAEIQVTNSKPAIYDITMEQAASDIEEIVVKASPFAKTEESPVSLRSISTTEIQRNPGGNRDISRVVQTLPGVTSTASFRNDLIIRGGAPNENRFYLDDVEVPNINHFATQGASGGPVGLINVDFIREVNFYSGAFPSNRANTLSSVFNFVQKNGRDDRLGATFTLGTNDIALTLEGPLSKNKKTTFLLSARQSYLQALFKVIGLPFLPTYNDAQIKVRHRFNEKHEIYFVGLGAIDQFKLNLDANETESQRFLLGNLPVSPQWNYTNGLVYKYYQENGYWTFVASRNMLDNRSYKYRDNIEVDSLKILDYRSQEIENKLRIETTQRFGKYKLNAGVNYEYAKYNNRTFSRINLPGGQEQLVNFASDIAFHKYGIFAQISRKLLTDRLILSLGARMDGNSFSKEMANPLEQFSPRFSAAYALNERISLNFNTGMYYQLPPYTTLGFRDENGTLVNRDLGVKYIRASHIVAGVEFNTSTNTRITVEGYYKHYNNYPFLLRDSIALANLGGAFGVIGNEASVSTAQGRTYGVEFLFQQRLFKGFYGILSYTLGWSQFQDKNGKFIASSWDSRHTLNAVIGKQFKKNWEIGLKFRLQTGLPFTPYDAAVSSLRSVWDIQGRGVRNFDLLNTERTAIANQLDFRVDKKWFFKKWSFNLYLDIQNAYGNAVGTPELILDEDANGNAQVDPADPSRYLLKEIGTGTGTVIPTLGIIVQF
jgi:hypothetical protein